MSQSDLFLSKELDGSLDAFVTSKRPEPEPIATSQEIRDRGSTFVATIYQAKTPEVARARASHVKHVVHRKRKATHEIYAWRCMVLKPGRTGLEGDDDFDLVQGSKDDGESWAGGKVLKVMQNMAVIDAVVVVTRWYGGTMLGPARFTHIETCATEVCKAFKQSEELQDHIEALRNLDSLLSSHREELASLRKGEETPNSDDKPAPIIPSHAKKDQKKSPYEGLDIPKAKRLIQAREASIKTVKSMIAKLKEPQPK